MQGFHGSGLIYFFPGGVAMQMFSVCGVCADPDDGVLGRRHSQTRWFVYAGC